MEKVYKVIAISLFCVFFLMIISVVTVCLFQNAILFERLSTFELNEASSVS